MSVGMAVWHLHKLHMTGLNSALLAVGSHKHLSTQWCPLATNEATKSRLWISNIPCTRYSWTSSILSVCGPSHFESQPQIGTHYPSSCRGPFPYQGVSHLQIVRVSDYCCCNRTACICALASGQLLKGNRNGDFGCHPDRLQGSTSQQHSRLLTCRFGSISSLSQRQLAQQIILATPWQGALVALLRTMSTTADALYVLSHHSPLQTGCYCAFAEGSTGSNPPHLSWGLHAAGQPNSSQLSTGTCPMTHVLDSLVCMLHSCRPNDMAPSLAWCMALLLVISSSPQWALGYTTPDTCEASPTLPVQALYWLHMRTSCLACLWSFPV